MISSVVQSELIYVFYSYIYISVFSSFPQIVAHIETSCSISLQYLQSTVH